jgi:CHAD domain-containing protein
MTRSDLVSPDEFEPPTPPEAAAGDLPAAHVRARIDQQLRALVEHEAIARQGTDPEGVHQMRVAVRRIRAALKASGVPALDAVQPELRWLGGVLGQVRDLDVLLGHLHGQAADLSAEERAAADRLLRGLVEQRRRARRRMLDTFRGTRYTALLRMLTEIAGSDGAGGAGGTDGADANGQVRAKKGKPPALLTVVVEPHRKLAKAVRKLSDDPTDEELHALRIRGKRLRYAAELAEPTGGKRVRRLIAATKRLQDVLGDHQDAVVAEQELRRLLDEQDVPEVDVVFVAGRLVEREQARRAACRAQWRAGFEQVDRQARDLR